jgi:ABC-type multidrug transport system permease subunit
LKSNLQTFCVLTIKSSIILVVSILIFAACVCSAFIIYCQIFYQTLEDPLPFFDSLSVIQTCIFQIATFANRLMNEELQLYAPSKLEGDPPLAAFRNVWPVPVQLI